MGRPRDNRGSAGGITVPRSTHNRGFRLALTGLSGSPYGVGTTDASTSGFTSAVVVCVFAPSSSPSFVAVWLVVVTTVIAGNPSAVTPLLGHRCATRFARGIFHRLALRRGLQRRAPADAADHESNDESGEERRDLAAGKPYDFPAHALTTSSNVT